MKPTTLTAVLLALALGACSKKEPAPAEGAEPAASESASTPSAPATPVVFDPKMPSFKCGTIRCNLDYYCVQRKQGTPTEVCTTHPPGAKREGCTKVATRTFTCETFP